LHVHQGNSNFLHALPWITAAGIGESAADL